ncbi:MAG: hypothetical protein HY298_14310 [Verrucomicrobia bacterium]|nr:hypothetical protein [Verrucomicrobiota bacterium]
MNKSKLNFSPPPFRSGDENQRPLVNRNFPALVLLWLLLVFANASAQTIGNHPAVYDERGLLQPWTSWRDAIDRELNWYLKCPVEQGYPRFVYTTFMDGNYKAIERKPSFIPATQNGMGIISYLKYYAYKDKKDPRVLQMARNMGDYLVKEAITPDTGKYPRFSRSTGWRDKFPQPPDCGSQDDKPYEIQPDKGGIAGYALLLLYEETKDEKYLQQALQNGRVLVANMREGTATNSPWPFRVDYRTGESRGEVAGNMSFILRLFDKLIEHGHKEFQPPRDKLWAWIRDFQIPNLAKDGLLWVQFFEDHHELDNRTAWSPLNLARYLIEKKDALDLDWERDVRALIEFVNRRFITIRNGVAVCGEQTHDVDPWGGILSTYGAVLAMYSKATGSNEYKAVARQALNYCLYAVNDDGCPGERADKRGRGGWQEDAHTDKLHNFVDAMTAFPEWGK